MHHVVIHFGCVVAVYRRRGVVHQRYQEGSHMCHIGFTAAEFIENIFYMLDVELAEPILYLGRRPFFFVYPDSFFAACEHFCRDVYELIYCGFLKGQIGYESFIMDLIFENGSRLSRKWIVFCNNMVWYKKS